MSDYTVGIDIRADSSSLKSVNREVEQLKGRTKDVSNNTGNIGGGANIASLKRVAIGMAAIGTAAVAAAAAAKKVADVVSNEFRDIQNINDFALFTGASAQGLAELEGRAVTAGVEFNRLREIITRQQEKLQEGNVIFEQLGLSIDRLSVLDPAEAFQEVINAIEGADSTALRARGITQLLGESGVEALKLAGSVEQVKDQLRAAQEIGLVIDAETLANANEFDGVMNSLNASATGLRRSLVDAFGPALITSIEALTSVLNKINPTTAADQTRDEIKSLNRELEDLIEKQKEGLISPENGEALRNYTRELRNLNDALLEQQEQLARSNERLEDRRLTPGERASEERWNATLIARIAESEAKILVTEQQRVAVRREINTVAAENLRTSREQAEVDEKSTEEAEKLAESLRKAAQARRDAASQSLISIFSDDSIDDLNAYFDKLQENLDRVQFDPSVPVGSINIMGATEGIDEFLSQRREINNILEDLSDLDIQSAQGLQAFLTESLDTSAIESLRDIADSSENGLLMQLLTGGDVSGQNIRSVVEAFVNGLESVRESKETTNELDRANLELFQETTLLAETSRQISEGRVRNSEELNRYIENERTLRQIIAQIGGNISDQDKEKIARQIETNRKLREQVEIQRRSIEDYDRFVDGISRSIGDSIGNGIIEGLETGKINFREWAADIGNILIRSGIQELVASIFSPQAGGRSVAFNLISSIAGSMFGGGGAAPTSGGGSGIVSGGTYAMGGVVNGPTNFMHSGGMGLMGEAGPEGILPLKRMNNGKLGVESSGGGSNVVNINTTVNVSGGQDDSNTIADRTSRAIERTIEQKVYQVLAKESRSGNALNKPIRNF